MYAPKSRPYPAKAPAKGPCMSGKEPCILAKEPYISVKESFEMP